MSMLVEMTEAVALHLARLLDQDLGMDHSWPSETAPLHIRIGDALKAKNTASLVTMLEEGRNIIDGMDSKLLPTGLTRENIRSFLQSAPSTVTTEDVFRAAVKDGLWETIPFLVNYCNANANIEIMDGIDGKCSAIQYADRRMSDAKNNVGGDQQEGREKWLLTVLALLESGVHYSPRKRSDNSVSFTGIVSKMSSDLAMARLVDQERRRQRV